MDFHEVLSAVDSYPSIALISHIMPDGDTIGSALALAMHLKASGKEVALFCEHTVPPAYCFLSMSEAFRQPGSWDAEREHYPLVIAVDCSDLTRLGACLPVCEKAECTVNIDHHISNEHFAEINLVDDTAAAVGEMIFSLIRAANGTITRPMAEALYAAISLDTGNFSYSNTTSTSHRIAAELLDCGIDVYAINNILFRTHTIGRTRLLTLVLATLEMYRDNTIAAMTVTDEMIEQSGADESETEGMINFAREINTVEVGLLFRVRTGGKVKVSFRSKERIDVSMLAQAFGGGGHTRAAGCTIEGTLEETKKQVFDRLLPMMDTA